VFAAHLELLVESPTHGGAQNSHRFVLIIHERAAIVVIHA